ncbi:MAG: hypothetical protein JO229_01585 [Alphaproteobacteria bacterium]|nr:hypothetical protein [Alphaproteobacteria bacterium]MBV9814424.1 hypothetical protein [Alphaproteobacteria bacterium]
MKFPRLGAYAIAAAMQVALVGLALAQGAPPAPSAGAQPGYSGGGAQMVEATPSSETTPGSELPVLYVTSVEVMRTSTEPKLDIVRVTGLTGSQGWSAPQLVPTFVGKPSDGILDLQFIATMPDQTQPAEGFVPIGAVFPLEEGHLFKGVRVRASENAIEVKQLPGMNQAQINVNDCKDCVGKKFVERGQAQPGQQGVVRQEDLPKVLRWIIPSRGIRGITHNPNRLNLILGDDNTIIAAYWE